MQLFYNPNINEKTKKFEFDKSESRHIVKVLRKSKGDFLFITDGKGLLYSAEITLAHEKKCTVNIKEFTKKTKPWNYYLHIAIAPTKLNDRIEWFMEKATEIGIDEISPIICEHSERKVLKMERLSKIVSAAMKQSLKFQLPKINEPITFKNFVKQDRQGDLFIAHCENREKKSLKELINPSNNTTILIGPEGDFSTKEIDLALQKNYKPISLGKNRLRTETAGVVACHSMAFANEGK